MPNGNGMFTFPQLFLHPGLAVGGVCDERIGGEDTAIEKITIRSGTMEFKRMKFIFPGIIALLSG